MRSLTLLLIILITVSACSTKKTETSSAPADSVVVDSTLATMPAPALLAFSAMDGYLANKNLDLPDSTNYYHLNNQGELDQRFTLSGAAGTPDFIINYVVAIACAPSRRAATITMDKVLTGENSIDVYLNINRSTEGKTKITSAQVFAIERREGYPVMQFYVNGKKDKAVVLVENQ